MAAATEKQIACIQWITKELGIPGPSDVSKEVASQFISKHINAARDHKVNRLFDREMRRMVRGNRRLL